ITNIKVKMGVEEGEVMQQNMLNKYIERVQRKVEEIIFGIRKRLLEYDDVMNSQRTVIYSKRKNALYGERLDVDLNNTIYDVVDELVQQHKQDNTFEEFQLDLIRLFAITPQISEQEFGDTRMNDLTEDVFEQVINTYHTKAAAIASQTYPV